MVLIIGGAYQGKLEFAKNEFNIPEKDVFSCASEIDFIDFNKSIINRLDLFVLAMIKKQKDPVLYIKDNLQQFNEKIIICDDISCGVVPIEYENRILREKVGHCLAIISKKSDRVVRLFCGIPMDLK